MAASYVFRVYFCQPICDNVIGSHALSCGGSVTCAERLTGRETKEKPSPAAAWVASRPPHRAVASGSSIGRPPHPLGRLKMNSLPMPSVLMTSIFSP